MIRKSSSSTVTPPSSPKQKHSVGAKKDNLLSELKSGEDEYLKNRTVLLEKLKNAKGIHHLNKTELNQTEKNIHNSLSLYSAYVSKQSSKGEGILKSIMELELTRIKQIEEFKTSLKNLNEIKSDFATFNALHSDKLENTSVLEVDSDSDSDSTSGFSLETMRC